MIWTVTLRLLARWLQARAAATDVYVNLSQVTPRALLDHNQEGWYDRY